MSIIFFYGMAFCFFIIDGLLYFYMKRVVYKNNLVDFPIKKRWKKAIPGTGFYVFFYRLLY